MKCQLSIESIIYPHVLLKLNLNCQIIVPRSFMWDHMLLIHDHKRGAYPDVSLGMKVSSISALSRMSIPTLSKCHARVTMAIWAECCRETARLNDYGIANLKDQLAASMTFTHQAMLFHVLGHFWQYRSGQFDDSKSLTLFSRRRIACHRHVHTERLGWSRRRETQTFARPSCQAQELGFDDGCSP